jgi:hypothetical protein
VGSTPDEVDSTAKATAVAFCRDLILHVDPGDTNAITSILNTVGALSNQAAVDAVRALIPTKRLLARRNVRRTASEAQELSDHWARHLAASAVAQDLLVETNAAIHDVATSVLSDVTPGENPVSILVRKMRCLVVILV